jgi:DNA-binding response OmpR family regulator
MTEIEKSPALVDRRPAIPFGAIGGRVARRHPTTGEGCPCCGATLNAARPFIDLNTNALIYKNTHVQLEPIQAAIVGLLAKRMPGVVAHDSLIMHVWEGDNEPEDARGNVKAHIHHVRGKLALLGISIFNIHDVGYRLVLA